MPGACPDACLVYTVGCLQYINIYLHVENYMAAGPVVTSARLHQSSGYICQHALA